MRESDVLGIFKKEQALLSGHFLLSSGLHSAQYMQCALVLQKPWLAEKLCRALAKKISKLKPTVVIGPALGGVVVSYEMARALKVRSLFAERVDGALTLRRGFSLKKNERVLVVEDVITTGKSTKEVIAIVEAYGAKVVGIASIVNRSDGKADFDQPFYSLLSINIETNSAESCSLCREGKTPVTKPGSRGFVAAVLLLLFLICPFAFAADNEDSVRARQAYESYLQELKKLNKQYKEITAEIQETLKDQDVPVWDEKNDSLAFEKYGEEKEEGVRIKETDREMIVSLDMPGIKRESLQVTLVGEKELKITGQRKDDSGQKVERSVQLTAPAYDRGTYARYEDGVLMVWVTKAKTTQKEIPVSVS